MGRNPENLGDETWNRRDIPETGSAPELDAIQRLRRRHDAEGAYIATQLASLEA